MDQQLFQGLTVIFGLMATIIGALIMLWIKSLQTTLREHKTSVDSVQAGLTGLALDLAKNYPTRQEIEKKLDDIFSLLDEIRKEVRHATT